MYVDYYNLRGPPFRLNPDHRFFYVAEPHKKAVAHLKYALSQGEGFVVITGEVGAGKTTLVNHMLADLTGSHCVTGTVVTTSIEHEDLIRLVAAAFGLRHERTDKATHLLDIRAFLEEQHAIGRHPVLFVDEAQNLPASSLEELRMLSNFCLPGEALLQIFLVGQPQFKRILANPDLEQLRQRVITSCHLGALHAEDTRNYILHRLRRAGWHGDPEFSDRSFELIHLLSRGIPRRINLLCDRLLLYGYLEQCHRIDTGALNAVVQDMTDEGLMPVPASILLPNDLFPDETFPDNPFPGNPFPVRDNQAPPEATSSPCPESSAEAEKEHKATEMEPAARTGEEAAPVQETLLTEEAGLTGKGQPKQEAEPRGEAARTALDDTTTAREAAPPSADPAATAGQPRPPQMEKEIRAAPTQPGERKALARRAAEFLRKEAAQAQSPKGPSPKHRVLKSRALLGGARTGRTLIRSVLAAAVVLAAMAVPRDLLPFLNRLAPEVPSLPVIEMKERTAADASSALDPARPGRPASLPPEIAQKSGQIEKLLTAEPYLIPASNAPDRGPTGSEETAADEATAAQPSSRRGGVKLGIAQSVRGPGSVKPSAPNSEIPESGPVKSGPVKSDVVESGVVESGTSGPKISEPKSVAPAVPARKPTQLSSTEAHAHADRFLIQLAALRSNEEAGQLREQLAQRFGDLFGRYNLQIREAEIAGVAFYRVQSGTGVSREQAAQICTGLREQGQDCILIPAPPDPDADAKDSVY